MSKIEAGVLDDLKKVVKQEELYIAVKLFSEHITQELGNVQQIIEYCGMTKQKEEVVAIAIIPSFQEYTVICKEGTVSIHKK